MKPITFKEKNRTLAKPPTMTDEQCCSLDVFSDGKSCLSCWTPSWKERLSILFYGRVWLWVVFGNTQPPVSLLGTKTAFVYPTLWGKLKRFSDIIWLKRMVRAVKIAEADLAREGAKDPKHISR